MPGTGVAFSMLGIFFLAYLIYSNYTTFTGIKGMKKEALVPLSSSAVPLILTLYQTVSRPVNPKNTIKGKVTKALGSSVSW